NGQDAALPRRERQRERRHQFAPPGCGGAGGAASSPAGAASSPVGTGGGGSEATGGAAAAGGGATAAGGVAAGGAGLTAGTACFGALAVASGGGPNAQTCGGCTSCEAPAAGALGP